VFKLRKPIDESLGRPPSSEGGPIKPSKGSGGLEIIFCGDEKAGVDIGGVEAHAGSSRE
jgi:hypothetical protein